MASNNLLNEQLKPKIEVSLNNPNNLKALDEVYKKYNEKNIMKMTDIAPMTNILFTTEEKNKIYEILGVTAKEVRKIINESSEIKSSAQVVNEFNLACSVGLVVLAKKKDVKHLGILRMLMFMSFYPSTYTKYFRFDPNREIMHYVVNNMSNRFNLKTMGLYGTLHDMAEGAYKNFEPRITSSDDKTYVNYVCDIKNRINSFFKNVFNEFKKAHTEGKYFNSETDNFDEANYTVSDNTMLAVNRATQATIMKLSTTGVNMQMVNISAKLGQVSVNELRNAVTKIVTGADRKELEGMVESMLILYLIEGKKSYDTIRSNQFLVDALQNYKKSNSNDKNIGIIKNTLDIFMNKYTEILSKTNRLASINNYRRSIYIYFTLCIKDAC